MAIKEIPVAIYKFVMSFLAKRSGKIPRANDPIVREIVLNR